MSIKNLRLLCLLSLSILLNGCASLEPFPVQVPLGKPDASKITIESKFITSFKLGDDAPYGKLYINSQPQGTFLKSQKIFTKEISQGSFVVTVCNIDNKCVTQMLNVSPNKHIYLDYLFENSFTVHEWRLVVVKTENYYPNQAVPQLTKNVQPNSVSVQTEKNNISELDKLDAMKIAKEKCLTLGFKISTDEFGKCILTLTK